MALLTLVPTDYSTYLRWHYLLWQGRIEAAKLLSQRSADDPLEAIMYLTSVSNQQQSEAVRSNQK
jgi:hypothetical protein